MFIKNLKKEIKQTKLKFLILLIFLIIFIYSIPKKIFSITSNSFEERNINFAYDYCGKTSAGYIFDIKKKINFLNPPKIINNRHNPDQYWIFYTTKNYDDKYIIILSNHNNKKILNNLLKDYKIINNYKDDCLLLKKND